MRNKHCGRNELSIVIRVMLCSVMYLSAALLFLSFFPTGAWAAVPNGDVNGDGVVNAADVVLAQRIAMGIVTATSAQLSRGDVAPLNAPDGVINAADVVVIQRVAMGSINTYVIAASAGANGSISSSGTVSVISGATATFTMTPDAGYNVSDVLVDGVSQGSITSYTFTNVTANHTISASFTADIDTTPPTGSIVINSGAVYTKTTTVTLTLSATDTGSGVSQMQFSNDNLTWSQPEAYATSKSWTLSSVDGVKTVYAKFKDTVGNWSGAIHGNTIILDTVAPTVTIISPTVEATNNKTPLLSYTVSDGTVVVKVDNVIVSKVSGDALSILSDGVHTVRVEATDAANNTSFVEVTFTVDSTPPTGSIVINSGSVYTKTTTVTLTLSATDTGSGVSQMQFSNDGSTWSTPEAYAASKVWTMTTGDGTKTVYAKFKDTVGNWASAIASNTITLDTVAPTVTIISPTEGATNKKIPLLSYTVSEGAVVVKVDGIVVSKVSGNNLDALTEGSHTVRVESTDSAGNIGLATVTFTVDTVRPSVSIDRLSTPISNNTTTLTGYYYGSDAMLTVAANTTASVGPVSYPTATSWSCTISGLVSGPNIISVTASDAAGNTDSAFITLDQDVIGLWHMAGGNYFDYSGNGLDGTGYNGVTFASDRMSASFDGINDYIMTTQAYLRSTRDSFSIAFWASPTGTRNQTPESTASTIGMGGQRYAIAPQYSNARESCAGVSVGTNGISVFEYGDNSYFPSLLVYNASLSGWNHIVVVYSNKQPHLYVNGQFVKSGLTSTKSSVYPSASFGNVGTYGPYKGFLKEIAIYKRAISSGEVAAEYASNFAPTVSIQSPAAGTTSNNNTPTLNYTVNNGIVTVTVDGKYVSKVSGNNLDVLSDGTHTVRVESVSSKEVTGFAETTFTIDTMPPAITIDPVTTPITATSQIITGTRESNYAVAITLNTAAVAGQITYPTATTWSCSLSQLVTGVNNITATATDAVGNIGTATASITVITLAISNVAVTRNTIDTSLSEQATIFYTLNSHATVTLKVIPEKLGPSGAPKYQASTVCTAAGAYSFIWAGRDNSGNVVSDEAYLYILEASDGTNNASYSPAAPTGTGSIGCSQGTSYDAYRNDPLVINYSVSQPVRIDLSINCLGYIFKVMDSVPHASGNYTFDWNGISTAGRILTGGATAQCAVASILRENVIITSGNTPIVSLLKTDPYNIQLSYGEFTRITYTLSRDANVTVTLIPQSGAAITLLNGQAQTAGANEIQWGGVDPSDTSGKKLLLSQEGDYTVSIQATNSGTGASSSTKGSLRIWR